MGAVVELDHEKGPVEVGGAHHKIHDLLRKQRPDFPKIRVPLSHKRLKNRAHGDLRQNNEIGAERTIEPAEELSLIARQNRPGPHAGLSDAPQGTPVDQGDYSANGPKDQSANDEGGRNGHGIGLKIDEAFYLKIANIATGFAAFAITRVPPSPRVCVRVCIALAPVRLPARRRALQRGLPYLVFFIGLLNKKP